MKSQYFSTFLSFCNTCSLISTLQTGSCGCSALHLCHCWLTLKALSLLLEKTDQNMEKNHTFLYFAYGSNLLKERLQLKNPSAAVYCVARLKNYRLVFGNHKGLASDRWHGGVATIEHSPGNEVWGVVWRMNISDLQSLDSQENVTLGTYSPVELLVKTKGQELNCRTYIMNSCVYAPPSPQYLQVIVMGAEQNGLPKDYQEKLRAVKTNMYEGPLPMMNELERARGRVRETTDSRSDPW
ncbi:gamma-glutamylcyclotransferase [Leuresthes tenuis]|uniref:gamma-glutamylcyclotransferase n=1 Tax=Leuresthes tenuis TaxID=355514 RepID=UPI003B504BB9